VNFIPYEVDKLIANGTAIALAAALTANSNPTAVLLIVDLLCLRMYGKITPIKNARGAIVNIVKMILRTNGYEILSLKTGGIIH